MIGRFEPVGRRRALALVAQRPDDPREAEGADRVPGSVPSDQVPMAAPADNRPSLDVPLRRPALGVPVAEAHPPVTGRRVGGRQQDRGARIRAGSQRAGRTQQHSSGGAEQELTDPLLRGTLRFTCLRGYEQRRDLLRRELDIR